MKMYSKFFAQILATVLGALVPLFVGNQDIGPTEWLNVAIIGVGAAAVFTAPNVPGAKYTKSILSVLTAVLTLASSFIVGGISMGEWVQIAVAALGALGVYSVDNTPGD